MNSEKNGSQTLYTQKLQVLLQGFGMQISVESLRRFHDGKYLRCNAFIIESRTRTYTHDRMMRTLGNHSKIEQKEEWDYYSICRSAIHASKKNFNLSEQRLYNWDDKKKKCPGSNSTRNCNQISETYQFKKTGIKTK